MMEYRCMDTCGAAFANKAERTRHWDAVHASGAAQIHVFEQLQEEPAPQARPGKAKRKTVKSRRKLRKLEARGYEIEFVRGRGLAGSIAARTMSPAYHLVKRVDRSNPAA